jgi:hypothetical protein
MSNEICQKCSSSSVLHISGKTDDRFSASFKNLEHDGYVLSGVNIGGGDYVEMEICMNCGQVQGTFPVTDDRVKLVFQAQY